MINMIMNFIVVDIMIAEYYPYIFAKILKSIPKGFGVCINYMHVLCSKYKFTRIGTVI